MYQQSVDKSKMSKNGDALLFAGLVILFFVIGGTVLALEKVFNSFIPRYIFVTVVLIAIFIIYRIRMVGYRYTIFYKDLEPVYDPRFDAMTVQTSYPYPTGTLIFERISGAKGTILLKLNIDDIEGLFAPIEAEKAAGDCETSHILCAGKTQNAYSLVYTEHGKRMRLLFDPDNEFICCFKSLKSEVENSKIEE